jgi:DNA-directed RNA polymerase subunit RPC12/RpoP
MQELEIKPCPECGSKRMHASLLHSTLGVMPKNPPILRDLLMERRPNGLSKWLMKRRMGQYREEKYNQPFIPDTHRSKLKAIVCTNCGYTVLYATDPANLTEE